MEAVLLPDERDLGCMVVDIVGELSVLSLIKDDYGLPVFCLWDNLITNDVAIGLRIR